ncbi:hypothetical protein GCM10012275_05280 [Longimycelium tulufanense]|uniref:Iron-containing redox enzyme family protein n=1 Tax=Longimycelium tulufanense TaxID=907463 RepID=A0A8J3CAG5_9PSEU|nr:iron-containing redox enzyme family protein [Longimycelium tulufanense]GGM37094.1 hypothetical protein GCM10012275_05280 [Longimycelium tulufanense]
MRLPEPRGPVSEHLVEVLRREPGTVPIPGTTRQPAPSAVHDEDLQLSLFLCYELHYRGFDEVDDAWEWQPELLGLRAGLERAFEVDLRDRVRVRPVAPDDVPTALGDLTSTDHGPSLPRHLQRKGTLGQFREFVLHRSIYHRKEADPHTWGIPRLAGRPKAALVEIQADEYGGGQPERMHAEIFRHTMQALGLDDGYGRYVDAVPAVTLATSNVISLFGLRRRWRGALAGHLAAIEMTSSQPNRRYGAGLRRLGGDELATWFFDEHVVADAVHEQIAAHDLCGTLARAEPDLAADIVFGAACALDLDAELATHLLAAWDRGESSLRRPFGWSSGQAS